MGHSDVAPGKSDPGHVCWRISTFSSFLTTRTEISGGEVEALQGLLKPVRRSGCWVWRFHMLGHIAVRVTAPAVTTEPVLRATLSFVVHGKSSAVF